MAAYEQAEASADTLCGSHVYDVEISGEEDAIASRVYELDPYTLYACSHMAIYMHTYLSMVVRPTTSEALPKSGLIRNCSSE